MIEGKYQGRGTQYFNAPIHAENALKIDDDDDDGDELSLLNSLINVSHSHYLTVISIQG